MPRRSWHSFRIAAQIFVGGVDHRLDPRFLDCRDAIYIGPVGGVVDVDGGRILGLRFGEVDAVDNAGRSGDEVEVVFSG